MKTPVIIAAYNEAERIGTTLRALDARHVEPFVIVNGELGSQDTAYEAIRYTPNVVKIAEQGKLPAMQLGFRKLLHYDKDAFSKPILLTDADSRPLMSRAWGPSLAGAVAGEVPSIAAGTVLLNDGPVLDNGLRSIRRIVQAHRDRNTVSLSSVYGSNMAINFADDTAKIETILEAPHIWPSEDRYIAHVMSAESTDSFTQLTNLGSAMLTSARYTSPLVGKLLLGRKQRHAANVKHYASRRASSATHYFDWQNGSLHEYTEPQA